MSSAAFPRKWNCSMSPWKDSLSNRSSSIFTRSMSYDARVLLDFQTPAEQWIAVSDCSNCWRGNAVFLGIHAHYGVPGVLFNGEWTDADVSGASGDVCVVAAIIFCTDYALAPG